MSGPVTIPDTVAIDAQPAAGEMLPYRLLVAPAIDAAAGERVPVLYLLDGAATFGTVVEMIRQRRNRPAMTGIPPTMVVAITHPGAHPYDRERRRREYARSSDPAGGREGLLRFLAADVHPLIESRYPADPDARVLVGHSLAGHFTLYALLTAPDTHRGYVAISPSIWSDRNALSDAEAGFPHRIASDAPSRDLFLAVAEYDQALAPWQQAVPNIASLEKRRAERRMVDDARELAKRIGDLGGSRVRVEFYECMGEDHATVVPVALSRALRSVLRLDKAPP